MEIATSKNGLRALRGFFGVLVFFLYAPILILALFSFNDNTVIAFPLRGFTTRWYQKFLSNTPLVGSLRTSAIVAVVSSTIAVGLGVLISIALVRRRFAGKAAVSALVLSPLVIPYLVFGISLLILFKTIDNVLTDTMGLVIGLGMHAIIVGHVVVAMPYTVLTLVPRLEKLSISFEEAARDLGASGFQTFRRVTLPLLLPALVSSFLIAFTLSFDEYAIASFLAGDQATWPVYLFGQLRFPILLPQLIAVSVIVLVLSIILIVAAEIFRGAAERKLQVGTGSGAPL